MITVRGLNKWYGKHQVLNDVCFDLREGEITFLMGENGAGKTTMFKAMLGLEEYEGEILYDQRPLAAAIDQLAIVYDDSPLYSGLSGYTNIELLGFMQAIDETTSIAISLLGGELLKRKTRNYSYGQRKKLSIALALGRRPKYLLMDEVSNGLDYETMEWLKMLLRETSTTATVLLTGHQFDFYNSIVDRVLVLKDSILTERGVSPVASEPQSLLGGIYETVYRGTEE